MSAPDDRDSFALGGDGDAVLLAAEQELIASRVIHVLSPG